MTDQAVLDAIATFQSGLAAVGDLDGATRRALIPAQVAGFNMMQAFDEAIAGKDAALPSDPFAIAHPVEAAAAILVAASAYQDEARLLLARGYFGRAVAAVDNARG